MGYPIFGGTDEEGKGRLSTGLAAGLGQYETPPIAPSTASPQALIGLLDKISLVFSPMLKFGFDAEE